MIISLSALIAGSGVLIAIGGGLALSAFARGFNREPSEPTPLASNHLAFDAWRGAAPWKEYSAILAAEKKRAVGQRTHLGALGDQQG
jgi:hypothetical protein